MKRSTFLILILSVFSFNFLYGQGEEVKSFDFDFLIGMDAKDFSEKTLKNNNFNLIDYKGKIIMLVFWSKFCGGCNKEIPDLNRIVEENRNKNFELISVIDENIEELTNSDTTQYSLRIYNSNDGFYEYNRLIYNNKKINYEIITEGYSVRQMFGLPNSSPIILFIDEEFIIRDYTRAYYVYNNYEHLNKKLSKLFVK